MYKVKQSVGIHKSVNTILSLFYHLGVWHSGEATVIQTRIEYFYCIFHLLFPISLFDGAIKTDNRGDAVFLLEAFLVTIVLSIKLWFMVWKKEVILELFDRIGVCTIKDHEDFIRVSDTLKDIFKVRICLFCAYQRGWYLLHNNSTIIWK